LLLEEKCHPFGVCLKIFRFLELFHPFRVAK